MKAGWEVKPLGEIAVVIAGQSPKGSAYNSEGLGMPFYQGKKEFSDRILAAPTSWTTQITKEAVVGDILMSVRAPVGPINEASETICIGRGLAAIRPRDSLLKDFLWYVLLWKQPEISGNEGAVFASINKKGIENLSLPLPPLDEQKRIVAVLDAAFDGLARARANVEANLQNARELFENTELEIFNKYTAETEVSFLGDYAEFRNGLNFSKSSKGEVVKIVGVGDFKNRFWVPTEELNTVTIDGKLADNDFVKDGDILAVRSNGNRELIGRVMLVGSISEPISFSGFTIRIRITDGKTLPDYICHFLKTKAMRNLLTQGGGGANISNLNQKLLSVLEVRVPTIDLQRKAIVDIEKLSEGSRSLFENYQSKLADLDELRQSLLQKAFAGEPT